MTDVRWESTCTTPMGKSKSVELDVLSLAADRQ